METNDLLFHPEDAMGVDSNDGCLFASYFGFQTKDFKLLNRITPLWKQFQTLLSGLWGALPVL